MRYYTPIHLYGQDGIFFDIPSFSCTITHHTSRNTLHENHPICRNQQTEDRQSKRIEDRTTVQAGPFLPARLAVVVIKRMDGYIYPAHPKTDHLSPTATR